MLLPSRTMSHIWGARDRSSSCVFLIRSCASSSPRPGWPDVEWIASRQVAIVRIYASHCRDGTNSTSMSEVAVTSVSADDIARTSSGIELVLMGFAMSFRIAAMILSVGSCKVLSLWMSSLYHKRRTIFGHRRLAFPAVPYHILIYSLTLIANDAFSFRCIVVIITTYWMIVWDVPLLASSTSGSFTSKFRVAANHGFSFLVGITLVTTSSATSDILFLSNAVNSRKKQMRSLQQCPTEPCF